MKRIASVCLGLFVGLVSFTVAQEIPKQINGGVLNGKAISLPKPVYPPAARAVGASGAVTVQVLIDENGDVVSATAVSGHPLLRSAAVESARVAKFSPTLLSGNPVKVAGVITYNFVGPLYIARIGFLLSYAERTSSFGVYLTPGSFASQLPADWVDEKGILTSLAFEETPKPVEKAEEKKPSVKYDKAVPPPLRDNTRYTVKGDGNFTVAGSAAYGTRKLDARSVASVRDLSNLVEVRASVNPRAAWTYELGKALGAFVAGIDDRAKLQSDLAVLEALSERAPSAVAPGSMRQLKEFIEFVKEQDLTDEERQSITTKAEMLSNLRY